MNFIELMTQDLISDFEPESKYDVIRQDVAQDLLNIDLARPEDNKDSGLYGKVFELLHRSPNSKITEVRAQGEVDLFVKVGNTLRPCEVKTNSGRIGSLYKIPEDKRNNSYVVYTICRIKPQGTRPRRDGSYAPAEEWYLPPIIMTVSDFLTEVHRYNATSTIGHGTGDEEPNVRGDKGQFYRALLKRKSTYYVRGATYTAIL